MPEGSVTLATRDDDPYAWALSVAERLRRRPGLKADDRIALSDFLEEWADEMLAVVLSQAVNLLAHLTMAAKTQNNQVVGHSFSECTEFHDQLIVNYRPSMRGKIDLPTLWERARRRVSAKFRDYGEPRPSLPADCPVNLDDLLDPNLDLDRLVELIREA